MQIVINKTEEIFELNKGDIITKRNLMDLIQYSKVKGSKYWSDEYNIINNTTLPFFYLFQAALSAPQGS